MDALRIFSVEDANILVPSLNRAFEQIGRLRRAISLRLERMEAAGVDLDPERSLEEQHIPAEQSAPWLEVIRMARDIRRAVGQMQSSGCVVKDLDVGLVDFYSVVDGEPVWLCWQYGERRVGHYHPLDDGFGDRRILPGGKQPGVLYN